MKVRLEKLFDPRKECAYTLSVRFLSFHPAHELTAVELPNIHVATQL